MLRSLESPDHCCGTRLTLQWKEDSFWVRFLAHVASSFSQGTVDTFHFAVIKNKQTHSQYPRRKLDVGDFSDVRSIGVVCGNLKEAAHFEIEAWLDYSKSFGVEAFCSQRAPTTLVEGNKFSDVDIQFVLSALTESEFPTLDLKISKATYNTFLVSKAISIHELFNVGLMLDNLKRFDQSWDVALLCKDTQVKRKYWRHCTSSMVFHIDETLDVSGCSPKESAVCWGTSSMVPTEDGRDKETTTDASPSRVQPGQGNLTDYRQFIARRSGTKGVHWSFRT